MFVCQGKEVIDKKISYNPVVVFPIIVESIQDERGENIAFTASKKETGPFTFYHVAVIGDVRGLYGGECLADEKCPGRAGA